MLCILYYQVIGGLLSIGGILAERAFPDSARRRWLWSAVIVASFALPLISRFQHAVALHAGVHVAFGTTQAASESRFFLRVLPDALLEWMRTSEALVSPVWLMVSAVFAVWALGTNWHIARRLRHAPRLDIAGGAELGRIAPALVSNAVGPATVGIWTPRIAIPRWVLALPHGHRRYIVQHEDEHRRARDPLVLAMGALPLLILPWNLPGWWQLRRLRLAIEMDCDARVIAALGDPAAYGRVLLDVAAAGRATQSAQPALLGGLGSLERRMGQLLNSSSSTVGARLAYGILAIAIMAAAFLLPHPIWMSP